MTTPAAPAAPLSPTPDPSAPQSIAGQVAQMDAATFSKFLGVPESVFEPALPGAEPTPTAPDATAAPVPEPTPEPAPSPAPAAAEAAPSPAEPPTEKPPEKREPLAQFVAYDSTGELIIPDDLKLRFKANGKEQDVPLDKVVRLAQMGVYQEAKMEEARAAQAKLAQVEPRAQQLEQENVTLRQHLDRLLTAPEEDVVRAREAYAAQNTPEQKLARERQTLDQERQRMQFDREKMLVEHAVNTVILPGLDGLQKQYPTVSHEELLGRYTLLTSPLVAAHGRLPVDQLPAAQSLLSNDLSMWAASLHEHRASAQAQATQQAQAAKAQEALAQRTLARAAAPQGLAAPSAQAPPKLPATATAQDHMNAILQAAIQR